MAEPQFPLASITKGTTLPRPHVVSYPSNLYTNTGEWGYDKWMLFRVMNGRHILRSRGGFESKTELNPVDGAPQLCLYLPPSALQSEINLAWEEGSYGIGLGAAVQSAMDSGLTTSDITGAFRDGLKGNFNAASGVGKILAKAGVAGALALTADAVFEIAETVIKDPIQKVGGLTGNVPNPRTDIFFTSVKYRTHSFTWKLVPRSVEEAQAIDIILNTFQFYSLPSFGAENDKESGFFMGYPYEWSVQMFSETAGRGSKHHINTIDQSVVTRVNINHASNDRVSFIVDGQMKYYPTDTTLTVDMQEVRLQGRNNQDVIWRGVSSGNPAARTNERDATIRSTYPDPNTPFNITADEVIAGVEKGIEKAEQKAAEKLDALIPDIFKR
jgi:hypothetical protein